MASRTIKRLDLECMIDLNSPKKGRPSYIYKVKQNHIDNVFSQSFTESKTSDQDELDLLHSLELGKSQEVVTDDQLRINLVKTEENHIDNVYSQSLQSSQENSKKREDNNNIIYSDCEKTLSIENDYEKEQKNKGDDSPPLRVKQFELDIYDDIRAQQNDARLRMWALNMGAPEIRTQEDLEAWFSCEESTL